MNYFPEVIQVLPADEFKVYIFFDDGRIKLFDASELVEKGVFRQLKDNKIFKKTCTVLNGTLAWDVKGNFSERDCLDLDPLELYRTCPDTDEPAWLFKSSNSNA